MTKNEALAILGPIRAKRFERRRWSYEHCINYWYMLDGKPAQYPAVIKAAKERLRKQEAKRQKTRRDSGQTST